MQRELLISKVSAELGSGGFTQSACGATPGCFDLAARKDFLLLVKVLENIDGMTGGQAESLRRASSLLAGQEFLVGERTMRCSLEDGVLYERHEIPASNLPTFRSIINNENPHLRKFKKLTTSVDGGKLAQERQKRKLSLAELASLSKISIETLYRYEHNITSATSENIRRLESVFRKPLSKPVPLPKARNLPTFDFHGLESVRVNSPFDILGKEKASSASCSTIAFGFGNDLRTAKKRAPLYSRLSDVLNSYFCFIMKESKRDAIENIPIIRQDELSEISKPREIIKIISERSS